MVLHARIGLLDKNLVRTALPDAVPTVIGPAQAKGKIRLAGFLKIS